MASKSRIPVSLLIIDDTPEDRENYKDLLNQQEDYLFSIIEAEDAESGLDIYDCVEIDCILLDFSLPGIDGLRFLEEYKRPKHNHENSQFAPVVMISGRGSESIAVTALKNGAVDYLIKNEVNSDNIFRAVKNAVDRKNLQKQLLVQEQRRARGDKELKESEGRFRLLVNAVKDYALIMLTEDGRISSWNSGARRMLGYHDGEILGQHYRKLFRVEDIKEQIPERELAQAAEFGHIVSERYHLSRDAKQLWTHTTLTSVKDETGALKGFVEIFKDNSDLKAAQDGQTNSNGLLQLVLELSPIAILSAGRKKRENSFCKPRFKEPRGSTIPRKCFNDK